MANAELQAGLRQRAIDRIKALATTEGPPDQPPTDAEIEGLLDVVIDLITCGCLRALPSPPYYPPGPPHPDSVMGMVGGGRPTRDGIEMLQKALVNVADLADTMVQRGEPSATWELLRKVRETQYRLRDDLAAVLRDWRPR